MDRLQRQCPWASLFLAQRPSTAQAAFLATFAWLVCRAAGNRLPPRSHRRPQPVPLIDPHFQDFYCHREVRRFPLDPPGPQRTLRRVLLRSAIRRQRQLLPRVPLRQNFCLARRRPALCGHAGLAANLHAASASVLITVMWMAPVQAFMQSSQMPSLSHRPLFPVAADSRSVQLHPNGTPFVARHISERLFS